ncbi:hypothetical protein PF005_g12132 [Phytophthora fragariae]|uniref:Uncharacterized protein n=1 Tax=Phytophthora fragariae TaxID=53985 RepID=A0A6A3FEN4_9STRA|nr:hypothetical protein PF003_g1324 [Phytophthora fragariae]KAE8943593.1 hypothetical protein PF009_g6707 [Phytophthora fragariae]KAE8991896.1 hypothetical protein PF011_g17762 [Phytophthora fragariae]KAE9111015.1 hypothetical protein PF007_g11636 [Phytophthora fragariae]KAE9117702.1 hypothetical protein PF010_g8504 [Phytophthora fragariae]
MARYKKGHNHSSKRKHQKARDVKVSSTSTPAPSATAIDTDLFFSPVEAEKIAKLLSDLLKQVKTAKRVLVKFHKEVWGIKDDSVEGKVDRQLNLALLDLKSCEDNITAKINGLIRRKPQKH